MNAVNIVNTLKLMKIPQYFPDYDMNLFYLAFIPNLQKYKQGHLYEILQHKYKKKYTSYETLEYYGDIVLAIIVADIYKTLVGVNATPGVLTRLTAKYTANLFIRSLSHKHKICDTAYDIRAGKPLPKHNVCVDSFEAVLGALFIQYGSGGLDKIIGWYRNLFPEVMTDIDRDITEANFVPVLNNKNVPDEIIMQKFTKANPGVEFSIDTTGNVPEYMLFVDGYFHNSSPNLSEIIPIFPDAKGTPRWKHLNIHVKAV